jgi:hypothetical protein
LYLRFLIRAAAQEIQNFAQQNPVDAGVLSLDEDADSGTLYDALSEVVGMHAAYMKSKTELRRRLADRSPQGLSATLLRAMGPDADAKLKSVQLMERCVQLSCELACATIPDFIRMILNGVRSFHSEGIQS